MFDSKTVSDGSRKNVETFIGPSVKVEGDFSGEGNLIIEGMVIGNVSTASDLHIGKDAVVEAELKANNAHIAGRVDGNVTVRGKLEVTSTAQIIGNIKATTLSVESGGLIHGQLNMMQDNKKADSIADDKTEGKAKK